MMSTLLISSTGVYLHVDYCGDEIESIHFGETKPTCDMDGCMVAPTKRCCTSEQIVVEPKWFDYTLVNGIAADGPIFVYTQHEWLTSDTPLRFDEFTSSKYGPTVWIPSPPIRDLTQVSLC